MSSTLFICLDQDSIALIDTQSCAYVTGFIKIETDLANFQLPPWTRLQFKGCEKIDNTTHTLVNDTYQLSSRPSDWLCDKANDNHYKLPFRIEVPNDIPGSFHIDNYQEKEEVDDDDEKCDDDNYGVYYTIEATVSGLNQSAIEIVHFYRTSDSALLPRRLLWGIAKHSPTWQYEIDLPRKLDISSKPDTINIRLKSSQKNTMRNIAESCLVGCQFIQLVQILNRQDQYDTLMTDTQLLTSPHTTWQSPCQVSLGFDVWPIPSVVGQIITVSHFIRITFSFGNLTGSACQRSVTEFPVTVTGSPALRKLVIKDIPRSNSVSSSINEIASQDSAVDLPSSPSFKSIYSL